MADLTSKLSGEHLSIYLGPTLIEGAHNKLFVGSLVKMEINFQDKIERK